MHRRENLGEPIVNACHAIKQLADIYCDNQFVFPVHLNPKVQNTVPVILVIFQMYI